MRKLLYYSVIIVIALVTCASCTKKPSPNDKILATVSNKFITVQDFENKLAKVPGYYRDIVNQNKKRFLDETILEMLLYEEAIRNGVDRDKETREVIREAKKKIIIAKFIKNEVEDKIVVSDDEMKRFYESHKDDFKTPEMWRASHILVATETEANDTLAELSKGTSFEELAKTKSIDATASRGGDIGFFRKGQLVPDFEKVCLKLNVGEMSGVIHTQFGYHIIKLTDKKESSVEPYEKARRAIEDELKRKKRSETFDKLVQGLKKRYNVKIEEDVFTKLENVNSEKKKAAGKNEKK